MKAHERFRAVISGTEYDRLPMIEWATYWDMTVSRWVGEGMPKGLSSDQIQNYFGLDITYQHWFNPLTGKTPQPKFYGGPIIADEADYEKVKSTLYPEPKLSQEFIKEAKNLKSEGTGILWYTLEGYFWFPRVLFGIEGHMYAFYDQPDLYLQICEDLTEYNNKIIEYCGNTLEFDFMTFAEDMSYNSGPMISEKLFNRFMTPFYRKNVSNIKKNNVFPMVDSDGDITKAVGWFNDAGIEGILPLEKKAGVDVKTYIEKYPDMLYLGHYDKMVMDKGEAAMRAEFERLLPSCINGKVIISVDHQTPPAVSLSDYYNYLRLYKEYAVQVAKIKFCNKR